MMDREHAERMANAMRELAEVREELIERGRRLTEELGEVKRAGNEEEAAELLEALEHTKREYQEVEQRMRQMRADAARRGGDGREEMERRLHHLRVAAENLHAAGMHEQAETLMQQAERLARGGGRPDGERPPAYRPAPPRGYRTEPHDPFGGAPPEPMQRAVQDLHRQMDEMRGQMEEMRQALRVLMERQREGDR
jgi:hypothetical protein